MSADVPAAVLASVRSTSDRPIPHPRQEPTVTAPSPAGLPPLLDQLDEARALADQFSKALREHADDCICDRWVTHHSQMLAVIAGRIITAEVEARVQAAEQRAVEELEQAAADYWRDVRFPIAREPEVRDWLRSRADALAAAAQPGDGRTGA